MATGIKVIGEERLVRSVRKKYERSMPKVIFQASTFCLNEAKTSVQTGPARGDMYTRYNPKRTARASVAGDPPMTDTGNLVNNMNIDLDADGMAANVESNAKYSGYLEFGTQEMAARPFLQPALEKTRPEIKKFLKRNGIG